MHRILFGTSDIRFGAIVTVGSLMPRFQRCGNVVIFQIRIIAQDFFPRRASREHIEDVFDPDTQPSDAGAPAAGFWIDSYAVQHASHD
jgi:hypothetical protein